MWLSLPVARDTVVTFAPRDASNAATREPMPPVPPATRATLSPNPNCSVIVT